MAFLRVAIRQVYQGSQMRNVVHFTGQDAVQSNGQAISDAIRAAYVSSTFYDKLSSGWSTDGVEIKESDDGDNPTIFYPYTAGQLVGSSPAGALAAQTALLVSLRAYTARPNRGRVYLAGVANDQMSAGIWGSDIQSRAQTMVETWMGFAVSLSLGLALSIVRYDPITHLPTTSNVVAAAVAQSIPATQRRRRRGVGI